MQIRKLSADYIFDGAHLLKVKVLVLDPQGKVLDLLSAADLDMGSVEQLKGILSPGFINAHCHLE